MRERFFILKPFINLEGNGLDLEGVMIDTHSATMCSCNQSAWVLLRALRSKSSLSELTQHLVAEFDIDKQDARKDVMTFVHQLASMDLVDEKK